MKFTMIIVLFVFVVTLGCDRHESTYGTEWPFTVENTGGDCDMPAPAPDTHIVRTDADIHVDLARWAPWDTPTLE